LKINRLNGEEKMFEGDLKDIPAGFEVVKTMKSVTRRCVVKGNTVTSTKVRIPSSQADMPRSSGVSSMSKSHSKDEVPERSEARTTITTPVIKESTESSAIADKIEKTFNVSDDQSETTKYLIRDSNGQERVYEGELKDLPPGVQVLSVVKTVQQTHKVFGSTVTNKEVSADEMKVASKVRLKATCTIRGVVEGQHEAQQANTTRSGRRENRWKEERRRRRY
jgi:hypothetical protein